MSHHKPDHLLKGEIDTMVIKCVPGDDGYLLSLCPVCDNSSPDDAFLGLQESRGAWPHRMYCIRCETAFEIVTYSAKLNYQTGWTWPTDVEIRLPRPMMVERECQLRDCMRWVIGYQTGSGGGRRMLHLYKDGDHMGILTDIEDEARFVEKFSVLLARIVEDGTYAGDWEMQFAHWLPAYNEIVAKLKGYKANVRTRTVMEAGEFTPTQISLVAMLDEKGKPTTARQIAETSS